MSGRLRLLFIFPLHERITRQTETRSVAATRSGARPRSAARHGDTSLLRLAVLWLTLGERGRNIQHLQSVIPSSFPPKPHRRGGGNLPRNPRTTGTTPDR